MSLADSKRTRHCATNRMLLPYPWTASRSAAKHGTWTAYHQGAKRKSGFTSRKKLAEWVAEQPREVYVERVEEDVDADTLARLRAARAETGERCGR